jgi:hypothetical protein
MSNFGHVKKVTASVGGKEITFRSKLEYRYAVYLELLREQGHIFAWEYEPEELMHEFQHGRHNNTRVYIPDFAVIKDGKCEVHECKGYFPPIDYTKIKNFVDDNENPFVLIFGYVSTKPKKPKGQAQLRRIQRIEKHVDRVIYDANKTIFKPIKHLFEF